MKQEKSYRITGVSSLLMHNGQLANPLNTHAQAIKKITAKRPKTDADHAELARIEWYASLYLSGGLPCIPGEVLEATLVNAAKKRKKGQQAKAGLLCLGNFPLEYDGPQDIHALFEHDQFRHTAMVIVDRKRILRTRPIFHEWAATVTVTFNDELLNPEEVTEFVAIAGDIVGLMDWRPHHGRFRVE